MAVNRNRCLVLLSEIGVLITLLAIMLILRFTLTPFKRGFYCDDQSLMHPFLSSTVPYWTVLFVGFVINFGVIFILIPITLRRQAGLRLSASSVGYIVSVMWPNVIMLLYGFFVTYILTEIPKNMIGRFRPHFLTLCVPIYSGNCTATRGYIQQFTCSSKAATAHDLMDARKSFPSGHSSSAFFMATMFAIFLQIWMKSRYLVVLKAFLQVLFLSLATYVACSRISDYKHHWSDVLAGSLLGMIVAICSHCYQRKVRNHR